MRDYKTVAQRVLQRRDAYVLAKKRRRQILIKYAAVPACLFLVIGAGMRIWKQTDSGREILEQNKVEMTDATTKNTDNIDLSTDSALHEYETESQDRSEHPTPIQTGESLEATTDPIQTDAVVSSTDTESEPGHEAVTETRHTEYVITEVITPEGPVVQEKTEPEQNAISPTEKIPEPTSPKSDHTTAVSNPATETATAPTEPSEDELPVTVPMPTEPSPTDSSEPCYDPIPTEPSITTTDRSDTPPSVFPMTTATAPVKTPTNYTITVEEFTPTREQLSNVTLETVSLNFSETYNSFQKLLADSGAAVRCKVLSVVYTILQNTPYTVYNIEITESISGAFIKGDKLSIVQYGGYLVPDPPGSNSDPSNSIDPDNSNEVRPPSEQYSPELVEQQIAYSEKPIVSQEYVLFLTPDDVFDGAYETLHENEGMFRYNPETEELIRSVEQDTAINSSTYRELLEALKTG